MSRLVFVLLNFFPFCVSDVDESSDFELELVHPGFPFWGGCCNLSVFAIAFFFFKGGVGTGVVALFLDEN